MMRTVGIDVTDDRMLYIDRLTKAQIKAREPGDLQQRDEALKPDPNLPPEAIYIAGLRVLGFTMADIAHALAQAWRRNAVVYCIDIDTVFSINTPMPEMLDAIAEADDADRRARNAEKQARATDASQQKRARRKLRKLAAIRDRWSDPKARTADLIAEAGLSRRTVYTALGPRFEKKGKPHV